MAVRNGGVVALLLLTVGDGVIVHIDSVVDPIKLESIGPAVGVSAG
jgi:hypothetical protein